MRTGRRAPLSLSAGARLPSVQVRLPQPIRIRIKLALGRTTRTYGGRSPGPRFLVPALPVLLLGLPFAIARRPIVTASLVLVSTLVSTFVAVTWMLSNSLRLERPSDTVWEIVGLSEYAALGIVFVTAVLAVAVACAVSPPVVGALPSHWTRRDG